MHDRKDDLRERLRDAALTLFREQGYERATAAGIAARAGVTERTFFRHFPDKREVLFDGEPFVRDTLVRAIADAPDDAGPLDMLLHGFRAFAPALEGNRPYSKPRQEIISATPALRERELAKIEALTAALAAALRDRGVPDEPARIAARAGMILFVEATYAWLDDSAVSFVDRLDTAARELRRL